MFSLAPILDIILLIDTAFAFFTPFIFDIYEAREIEQAWNNDILSLILRPDKLIAYPIVASTEMFVDAARSFEYMFKYFMTDIRSYPD